MGQKYRSARGEIVDLDLLKIKQQIASTPKPVTVQERERFVDKRIRRRVKKQVVDIDGLDVSIEIKQEVNEMIEEVPDTIEPIVEDQTKVRPVRKKREEV